jgi:hypothetical protein
MNGLALQRTNEQQGGGREGGAKECGAESLVLCADPQELHETQRYSLAGPVLAKQPMESACSGPPRVCRAHLREIGQAWGFVLRNKRSRTAANDENSSRNLAAAIGLVASYT